MNEVEKNKLLKLINSQWIDDEPISKNSVGIGLGKNSFIILGLLISS